MLVKDIEKPDDYDNFISTKQSWQRLHCQNTSNENYDFDCPQTLGDKMTYCMSNYKYNWKLFNKSTAKDEVIKILGTDEYIIPTYQVCKSIDEIDWNNLVGKSFVIKPTSDADSHGVVIQKTKLKKKEIKTIKDKIEKNTYLKNTKIIVEKCILPSHSKHNYSTDYKFWCFYGKPTYCEIQESIVKDGSFKHKSAVFDINFNKIDSMTKTYGVKFNKTPKKPKNFEKMIEIASKLSEGMPVVRVDLYNINGKIYFGEWQKMYSHHCQFTDNNKNKELSYLLDLSKIPSQMLNTNNRKYDVKMKPATKEAEAILNATDDNFEFCFAESKLPLYYKTGEKDFIYKKYGFWYKQEYFNDKYGNKNCKTKIYNKRTKEFEPLRKEEARKFLNNVSSDRIEYQYDDQGDIVYYNKYQHNIGVKYVNGEWKKNEYETIKMLKK